MSELSEAINEMRNMRESYDQIGAAAEAYNTGKTELAENITAKGVPASASETLPELAEKVSAIAQESYTIDGGEMYAKQLFGSLETPNYWNLYEVLENLLSDGRLVSYGGILLAEYYKGYDSLALAGAGAGGAYVVSDKDSQGNFIMYTEDTTHTWDDDLNGKGNRWVAYCFADEAHGFQITNTGTSPRSIHIGRHVGVIESLVNGRVAEIIVTDGNKLDDFRTSSFAQNWSPITIIRNMQSIEGNLIYGGENIQKIYVETESLKGCIFCFGALETQLSSLIVKCKNFIAPSGLFSRTGGRMGGNISNIVISGAQSGRLGLFANYGSAYVNFSSLKSIIFDKVEGLDFYWRVDNTNVTPVLTSFYVSYDTNDRTKGIIFSGNGNPSVSGYTPNMTKIEIKNGWCKPLNVAYWTTLTEENIVEYILKRLGENTGQSPLTITLGATNLAKLTAEEIAIATNKGFTLA